MSSIERTAYPRFSTRVLKQSELDEFYSLTPDEQRYLDQNVRGDLMRLNFVVQLKAFQRLGHFPTLSTIPTAVIDHLKKCLKLTDPMLAPHYEHNRTRYRHQDSICNFLKINRWCKVSNRKPGEAVHPGRKLAISVAWKAAKTMNNPPDIINVIIEELVHNRYELPSFGVLDRIARHARASVNRKIFQQVHSQIDEELMKKLDELFVIKPGFTRTGYNALKRLPKSPTISHFNELIAHHNWLLSFGDTSRYLTDIAKIKLQQFATEAKSLDASDYKNMNDNRRVALIICLIHHAQRQAKDSLVIMYCRTLSKMHHKAAEKFREVKDNREETTQYLLGAFNDVLVVCKQYTIHEDIGRNVTAAVDGHGGAGLLHADCTKMLALNSNSHLPLLWEYFAPKRSTLMKLIRILKIQTASNDHSLVDALDIVLANADKRNELLENNDLDVSFASEKWKNLIYADSEKTSISRRYFEMAVFSSLADELKSGDVFINGAENYADYRSELLPWNTCQPLLAEYCREVGLPNKAKGFVKQLRDNLRKKARAVDTGYPDQSSFVIDEKGKPTLKKYAAKKRSPQAIWLANEMESRMPERRLLDMMCNAHHYTEWAHQFGPISGYDAKISNPTDRYILTNFAYGTRMGPTEAARHIKHDGVTAHMLSWINHRHITPALLDTAMIKLINYYGTFEIIKAWGDGTSCGADGTICYIREENLIAEFHLRYGHRGGIAYHHVSDQYIALFSTFIPCGVWEAVEIIEALLKNHSENKPDTIHADTQGQSAVVFALAYLFGIKLMPRIRNWQDLKFFRPEKGKKYRNIGSLFDDVADWNLIETHWPDLMQAALSIRAGKLSSSMLLRKLGTYSRKNRLFRAFQALGHVVRTQYLLEYISNMELRQTITATTNKVEQYNQLCDWTSFGSTELVASNDETEMEKAVKYTDLINNCIMLQNVIDMSDIIHQLTQEGAQIREDDIAFLSPYMTKHIKRYGDYLIDMKRVPEFITNASKTLGLVQWRMAS
jgi:TnpA family transposase